MERPPEGRSLDPAKAAATRFLEVPHPQAHAAGSSSWRRCATWRRTWSRPAGTRRSRRRAPVRKAEEGESAVRPIAHWDAELGVWADEEHEAHEPA